MAPKTEQPLKHIEFVNLGPGRALVVTVTQSGHVENRVIDTPLGMPPSALVEATNYLNARLMGRTFEDARRLILEDLKLQRAELNDLTARVIESGLATWAGEPGSALIVRGQARLLEDITAIADLERVRILFDALERGEGFVRLLELSNTATGVQIFIGSDNPLFANTGCSMVVAPFRDSQERILGAIREAAIAEFSRHGFKGASTKAIAERAGLTKPQLHYYISSKEELYEELLYSVLNGWSGAFIFDSNSDDPKKVLSSYVRKKLDYALDNPGLSRIFTTEVLGGGRNLGKYWPVAVKSTQQKVDLINRWIAEGRMRKVDAKVLLMQIWGMTQHYADYGVQVHIMLGLAPDEPIDREPIVRELTSFVLLGCGLAPD